MQRQRGRHARGVATDARILDAAIGLVDERGVDGVTPTEVSAEIGLTNGAFYARYANIAELLVDLWTRRIVGEVTELAREAVELAAEWPGLDPSRLGGLLRSTPERRVAFELLAVMPRIDELADVVPRSVHEIAEASGIAWPGRARGRRDASGSRERDLVALSLVALALGSAGHTRIDGSLEADAPAIADWVRRGAGWTSAGPVPRPAAVTFPSFMPPDSDGRYTEVELRRPRLLDGAASVIARSGIAGANLRRISRAAGYTHTAIYQEYGSLRELLLDLVRLATDAEQENLPPRAFLVDPVAEAAWFSRSLLAGTRMLRRLSLEFLVHFSHDPDLARVSAGADRRRLAAMAALVVGPDGRGGEAIVRYRYARRDLAFGLAVMEECCGGLDGLDWRLIVGKMMAGALEAAGVSPEEP